MTDGPGFLVGARTWPDGDELRDRCARCGYDWRQSPGDALAAIAAAPAAFSAALDGRDGMAPPADGGWNAASYVWHLSDLTRGWTERWVVVHATPGVLLAGWDPGLLAVARNYPGMPTVSALWSIGQTVPAFAAWSERLGPAAAFLHGDWGVGTVGEVLVWMGHEFAHHLLDVRERATGR